MPVVMRVVSFEGTSCNTPLGALNSTPAIPSCNPSTHAVVGDTATLARLVATLARRVATLARRDKLARRVFSSVDTSCSTPLGELSSTPTTPSIPTLARRVATLARHVATLARRDVLAKHVFSFVDTSYSTPLGELGSTPATPSCNPSLQAIADVLMATVNVK